MTYGVTWNRPQQERLSSEIRLEGIRVDGARELIEKRLAACELTSDQIEKFFADNWLQEIFTPIIPELGVRIYCKSGVQAARSAALSNIIYRISKNALSRKRTCKTSSSAWSSR
jgi:hypothetical protein